MITVAACYRGLRRPDSLADHLAVALDRVTASKAGRNVRIGEVRERPRTPVMATHMAPLALVKARSVAVHLDHLRRGVIDELDFGLFDHDGREIGGGNASVALQRMRRPVGVVEFSFGRYAEALSEDALQWGLGLLRAWSELRDLTYGRVSPGDGVTWWETERGRNEPRRRFYEVVDRRILNPDLVMFLSDRHLSALGVDRLE